MPRDLDLTVRPDVALDGVLVLDKPAGPTSHDVVTFADEDGIALRGGHHCNQPLMRKLGLASTTRASFYLYNTTEEADALADALESASDIF